MVDDNHEDATPSPDSGRARRTPPTIELEPSEVSGETRNAGEDVQPPDGTQPEPTSREPAPAISPWVIAAMSGAVAASLVICVGWMLGWPAVLPATSSAPPFNAAVVDDLAARVASIEARIGKPAAAVDEPRKANRFETVGKFLGALSRDPPGHSPPSRQ